MNKILVEGIKLYAYHGCLEEEARIGGHYIVDVTLETDFSKAAKTDDLNDTIDYCAVYEVVHSEMQVRSKLIEQVARRIIDKFKMRFPTLLHAEVKLTKLTPPINGDVEKVSVIIGF